MDGENRLLLQHRQIELWQRSGGSNPGFSIVRRRDDSRETVTFERCERAWGQQKKRLITAAEQLAGGKLLPPAKKVIAIVGNPQPICEPPELLAVLDRWYAEEAQSAWDEQPS